MVELGRAMVKAKEMEIATAKAVVKGLRREDKQPGQ